jgi:CHAT domain-containing protein
MNFRKKVFRFILLCLFISSGYIQTSIIQGNSKIIFSGNNTLSKEVAKINESLKSALTAGDTSKSRQIISILLQKIGTGSISDSVLSESYYFTGIYHLFTKNFNESIRYLNLCISIKEGHAEYDKRYAKALYNLGVAYLSIGDFKKHEEFSSKSLEIEKRIHGVTSPVLASTYLSLIIAYIELQEYDKAIAYSNIALTIANTKPDSVPPGITADLYLNLGVCYGRLADYSKAKIYLDKAESLYKKWILNPDDNFINLMNNSAVTYGALGFRTESEKYYEKVIEIAIKNNSPLAYNIINSYSILLGENGNTKKGEMLLSEALSRSRNTFESNPRTYIEVLLNYANYLRSFRIDNKKSLECYKECLEYLQKNNNDPNLKSAVFIGYSLSLDEAGMQQKALETIQSLLTSYNNTIADRESLVNPAIEEIRPDRKSLNILTTKYRILWDLYKKTADLKTLQAASNTSELIVSLIEKIRIYISEDDSRLILGDRYRDSYLNAIHDFNLLYTKTSDPHFLEKAFEYAEKSKAAGLLASTRELKATQLNLPYNVGEYEKKLQMEISLLNARIAEESGYDKLDTTLILRWKENLFKTTRSRDSLISVFEKQYPGYYSIKYNTHVADLNDIRKMLGRNGNYINYVLSDSILYTFIVNKRNRELLALRVDSSFLSDIRKFRRLLSMPLPTDNASQNFKEFRNTGYKLYKILIDPVRSYLISEKLLISPDNILSNLPFETLPVNPNSEDANNYRELSYLMNSFDISYIYSATFLAESVNNEHSSSNKLIAFAPDYPKPIDIQSVLMSRQSEMGVLNDLPFARQEAKYVTEITGGTLFENNDARESVFKAESGKYDIIHLAMHTLLNDKDPMRSTLIFSHINDSLEDGYLKTFEIYGIPLKAKMVVLSSCNTGSGLLLSGEGILSLARGFIYSGSQSVIMSMWEIEDKSGTEIVEAFYKNLKKGYSKSVALRKARMVFLNNADMLRSHPYFWSALVIYGDNSPLYSSAKLKIAIIAAVIIFLLSFGLYFWKRKYS